MSAAQGVFAPPLAGAASSAEAVANAKTKARELQFQLKLEAKHIEREARKIALEEAKLQRKMKALAQNGNSHEAQMLARSIVQSRKTVARLERTKASMQALGLQLAESIAAMSVRNCLKLSADVMRQMGEITRIPELEAALQEMRREVAACVQAEGVMEAALREDGDEQEEATGAEVQRVLEELALDRRLEWLAIPASGAEHPVKSTAGSAVPHTVPTTRLPGGFAGGAPPGNGGRWAPAVHG